MLILINFFIHFFMSFFQDEKNVDLVLRFSSR